jgi:hypothetical protein
MFLTYFSHILKCACFNDVWTKLVSSYGHVSKHVKTSRHVLENVSPRHVYGMFQNM